MSSANSVKDIESEKLTDDDVCEMKNRIENDRKFYFGVTDAASVFS